MDRTLDSRRLKISNGLLADERLSAAGIYRSPTSIWLLLWLLLTVLSIRLDRQAFGQPVTPEAVEKAIAKGVDFLRQKQSAQDGSWKGRHDGYGSGETALILLALLNCGLSPDDPTLVDGLAFLQQSKPTKTYESALQTMVYCAANPVKYNKYIRYNVQWLQDAQVRTGGGKGGWGYDDKASGVTDPSNSQFGVLALWEAQRSQVSVSPEAMRMAAEYWRTRQLNEPGNQNHGGWRYDERRAYPYSGSMTCAGIASLMMAEDALQIADAKITNDGLRCCMEEPRQSLVDLGLEWMQRNYSISENPGSPSFWFYYLYGLERVGRLTGQRFIANHDWYREGCELLIKRQNNLRGYIPQGQGNTDEGSETALALLFLSKGKRQVVIGRLTLDDQIDPPIHRHAIHHLTGHIEQAWKRDLAWQSISLRQASLEHLMETRILHISGSKAFELNAAQKQMLKDYVEQGNFLFAEARHGNGCSGEGFDRSFRALMEELFEIPLQKLSPDHPVWFAEAKADLSSMPKDFWLYGLETCCRTSVVYSPISLGCRWEIFRPDDQGRQFPDAIRRECQAATILGVNVATYATGRELKDKLDAVEIVRTTKDPQSMVRGLLRLPRLMHGGGAEETPRAIPNLMEVYKREISSQAVSESPLLAIESKLLEEPSIIYLSGRRSFQFSVADRQQMKTYFENGGMLIGDSVCGSQEFTDAVHRELSEVLRDASWVKVPSNHPMLTSEFQGFDIRRVTIQNPGTQTGNAIQMQRYEGAPVLELLMWKERPVAIFSPYDLSCALESRQSSQCRGYPRADAARIAINMMLYALLN
jgi:Domain of unknown function (DUF4159)